jgi:hypothetical protein
MNSTATTKPTRPPRRSARRGMMDPTPLAGASPQARRQAAAILEVLAGVRRPSEAAHVLETSVPRYYQLERRALTGLLTACEPAPRGPRFDLSRRIAALERENHRLQRECDRQQALVRAAERSLGLAMPALKPSAKGKAESPSGTGAKKPRRERRPAVRALKAARVLQTDDEVGAANGVVPQDAAPPVEEGG